LSEGESKEKHVAILKICKGKFNIQKIRLQSVRPFIMSDLNLSDHQLDPRNQQKVNSFISKKVRELVQKAKSDWIVKNGRRSRKRRMYSIEESGEEEAIQDMDVSQELEIPKPLVRLRVEYSGGYEIFNPQRFGQEFVDIVANPRDIIHFYRRKTTATSNATKAKTDIDVVDQAEKLDTMRVENLVQKYLSAQNLNVLPEVELADAVRIYVEKDEKDAVKEFVESSLDRMQKAIRKKQNIEVEEALLKEINKEKDIQAERYARAHPNGGLLDHKRSTPKDDMMDLDEPRDSDDVDSHAEEMAPPPKTSKGRGSKTTTAAATKKAATTATTKAAKTSRAAAASSRATKGGRSTKGKAQILDSQEEDEEAEEEEADNGHHFESDEDYRAPPSRAVASSSSKAQTTHVILDTDDEPEGDRSEPQTDDHDEEEEFLVPKRGAKPKGKEVVKSTAKAKPAPKPRATPAKRSATPAAATGTTSTGSTSRAGGSSRAATASQPASQGASRLVTSIGNRRKKLM
ncbi:Double-strand break repair protein mre11a, partial [Mortierella sp. NVP85]